MPNIINVEYAQNGQSTSTDNMGMRDMQARAYEAREAQYLLLKSPPASGKSRALMFLALDKLHNQGIKKAIIAVPERSIGGSFSSTDLMSHGFFANWEPSSEFNLCTSASDKSKVKAFHKFIKESNDQILICTHATFRFACEELDEDVFNETLIAIDEFHHVSADVNSILGEALRGIIKKSTAHVIAMTGSYFRGDSAPILMPEDETKFTKITYNYYEQLNGYSYLKTLGIGYHFYKGRYTSAIMEVLDLNKKTILHIPNVNSVESTGDKDEEVGFILDAIGEVIEQDLESRIIKIRRHDNGEILKVADLVDDGPDRDKLVNYLRDIDSVDDVDIIIALGMAKEGFDWPYCEHALTVGYRSSLTEIVQIIGRATRDSSNKTHAQFTNLVANPDAEDVEVKVAVNNMLKAITASLLMEQVLAPSFKFKTKLSKSDKSTNREIKIFGLKEPSTQKVKDIVESDLNDLKAKILQDKDMLKAMPGNIDPKVMNEIFIPRVIRRTYPELSDEEVNEVRQHVVTDSAIKNSTIKEAGDKRFIRMAGTFIDIEDLNIDLIDNINPFQEAFEVMSKQVTQQVLKVIQEAIQATRVKMDWEEAKILWPKVQEFVRANNRDPNINSNNSQEQRLAECVVYLKDEKRKIQQNGQR